MIELRPGMSYDEAWMIAVDALTRDWDVDTMEKDSGYLRTGWHYGISKGPMGRYRGRIIVKFPDVQAPTKVELKTEAQWLCRVSHGMPIWITGYDSIIERDFYMTLGGRLGRTVPRE
jgi:hypothetical protein